MGLYFEEEFISCLSLCLAWVNRPYELTLRVHQENYGCMVDVIAVSFFSLYFIRVNLKISK